MIESLQLKKIRLDGGTQPRAKIDTDVVTDYAERLDSGDEFPPVEVFHDGACYWLADGFHRYHANAKAEKKSLRCNVRKGTVRDAILFSCGANISHGVRRTNKDKRQVVETLLADAEWVKYSDRKIADICCVSHPFVADVRSQVVIVTTCETRTGSDGKSYPATNGAKELINEHRMEVVRDEPTEAGSADYDSGFESEVAAEPVAVKAKAKPPESNLIGDVIRQITAEMEYAIEPLPDYQVAAVFEGVALWMAEQRERRGIK